MMYYVLLKTNDKIIQMANTHSHTSRTAPPPPPMPPLPPLPRRIAACRRRDVRLEE